MSSLSPPLSPLTFNASTFEDEAIYQWSQENEDNDCNGNNNQINAIIDRVDSAGFPLPTFNDDEQAVAIDQIVSHLEPTPKAGVASDRRRKEEQKSNGNEQQNKSSHHREARIKTPKVTNTSKMNKTIKQQGGQSSGPTNDTNNTPQESLSTNEQESSKPHNRSDSSVTSFTSVWRRLYRQRKAMQAATTADATAAVNEVNDVKRNDTHGTASDDDSLRELEENDAFALEVGLMFSADDGDTIANADLYSQGLPNILTMDSLDSISTAGNNRNPSSDLSAYLNQHRNTTYIPNNLSSFDTEDKNSSSGYIQNTKYAVSNQAQDPQQKLQSQQSFFNDDASKDTNTTVRDDHGNRLPPNAKAILSFKKNTNTPTNNIKNPTSAAHANALFPPIPTTQSDLNNNNTANTSHEEMEKRLRDLAAQLNHDWRTGPTTFIASPALARRLRDFQFAREKRRKKYGIMKPWGILGLYDHLSGVRIDVEWAEDAAWRRMHSKPYLTWGEFETKKNAGNNRPFFTYFVVSMCTAMMFASWFVNGWQFEPLSVNPMIGPSAETLLRLGAKDSYLIVYENEYWRLVSPMVLHAGLIHYILNMFALWYVGKAIELIHGHFQAAMTFVVPAIGGTILSAIFLPQYITVGASGGIFGLIGACISDIVMNWNLLFNEFVNERGARMSHARVLIVLLIDIILNCLLGLTPFVDNFTHLGGMIYGFLCGLSTIQMVSPRFFGDDRRCVHRVKLFFFRFFGLIISAAGIITSCVFLFTGDGETNPCPSCSVMSCVPFPPWKGPNDKWWYCDDCNHATAEGTLNTVTGKFIEMDLTCPDDSIVNVKVNETWPQDELGLEAMLPLLCRERCL